MASFDSAKWLRRYGKCQSLNEVITAARMVFADKKPNKGRFTVDRTTTKNTSVPTRSMSMRTHTSRRQQIVKILEVNAGKKSVPELAQELGLSIGYLRCTAQSYGISMAMPPKITEHDKYLMRCLRAEGMTIAVIAEKFECGEKTVFVACEGVRKGRKAA